MSFPVEITPPVLTRAVREVCISNDARVREKDSARALFISIEGLTRREGKHLHRFSFPPTLLDDLIARAKSACAAGTWRRVRSRWRLLLIGAGPLSQFAVTDGGPQITVYRL
jgi:hypothetical protein